MQHTHVYPVGDLIEHNTDNNEGCACNPKFEYDFENDSCSIVHDSLDRRELYE